MSGLSPRTRGKHGIWTRPTTSCGPIPANTGETQPTRRSWPPHRAYPREHGGNAVFIHAIAVHEGLSPRTRGKLSGMTRRLPLLGPIPANTGETRGGRGMAWPSRAYPREHGGNHFNTSGPAFGKGLSPRTRGKQTGAIITDHRIGPIPANTGETRRSRGSKRPRRAYPREHGGNIIPTRGAR